MTKKIETLSFISKISRDFVKREIENHNAKLEHIRRTLADNGENLSDGVLYQHRGADWKRKEVIQGCKDYIERTKMPEYLQPQALQAAHDSCNNIYIQKVHSAMFGLKLDLATEVEIAEDGKWVVAKSVADAMLEKERRVLDDDEVEAYHLYQDLIRVADQLHKRYYFISNTYGSEEDNLYHLDTLEADLEHFLMLRCLSPEEKRERMEKFGV